MPIRDKCKLLVRKSLAYAIGCMFLVLNFIQVIVGAVILGRLREIIDWPKDSIAAGELQACGWAITFGVFGVVANLFLFYGLFKERRTACQWWWRYLAFSWIVQMLSPAFLPIPIYFVVITQIFAAIGYSISTWIVYQVTLSFQEGPLFQPGNYLQLGEIAGRTIIPAESLSVLL